MKKLPIALCLLAAVLLPGFTVPNDVIYSEGDATVKYQEGYVEEVYIGDVYDTGDTVTTGYDGFVELDQDGLALKINPDTVFTLQEKEEKGEKTGVFSLALGSIKFRYARITGNEVWLHGFHIPPYSHGNVQNHDPVRPRKLLLHKRQIAKLRPKVFQRGLTLVPLEVYFSARGLVKVELALAQGKAQRDKRQDLKKRDHQRDIDRAMRRR